MPPANIGSRFCLKCTSDWSHTGPLHPGDSRRATVQSTLRISSNICSREKSFGELALCHRLGVPLTGLPIVLIPAVGRPVSGVDEASEKGLWRCSWFLMSLTSNDSGLSWREARLTPSTHPPTIPSDILLSTVRPCRIPPATQQSLGRGRRRSARRGQPRPGL